MADSQLRSTTALRLACNKGLLKQHFEHQVWFTEYVGYVEKMQIANQNLQTANQNQFLLAVLAIIQNAAPSGG